MSGWLFSIIGTVLIVTIVLMLMDRLDFGVKVDNFWTALVSAISIGMFYFMFQLIAFGARIFNADIGSGLLSLVVLWILAAAVLYFVAWLRRGFEIRSFLVAMLGVLVMGLLITGMQAVIGLFI